MSFKGTKEKWQLVEYPGFYVLQDGEYYGDANLFDVEDVGEVKARANAELAVKAPEMYNKIESILHMSEERGVAGCTWGDTDFDSLSVAYGFNLALEYIKEKLHDLKH